jgi:hypothetical protein
MINITKEHDAAHNEGDMCSPNSQLLGVRASFIKDPNLSFIALSLSLQFEATHMPLINSKS